MKKIILLLIAVPTIVFAQEKKDEKTIYNKEIALSLNINVSDPAGLGLFVELPSKKDQTLNLQTSSLIFANYAFTSLKAENSNLTFNATGYEIGFGSRIYFNEIKNKGFYFQNLSSYGSVKFNDYFYKGKYSYISIISPDLGFKAKIAKVINFEASAGFMWKLEIKGTEDVDNKSFDNLVPKFGLKLGYIF